ncbi:MAG: SDR family NAD(P)-dependent oxidoreductase [Polyangiales bacterium]|nr:SDR family NAD(P)-dependent oxidoreductase [Myxococcales bacterium]MCB9659075.1 SDR family NAD(P)-dependent oxidoreductase [Sandaracinaceae bacterium]
MTDGGTLHGVFVRHRHVVVFGAQRAFGHRVVEALLALGAHVIAVGPLRTELEALRAEMRQHHNLHTAECSSDRDGPVRLLAGALRRGHVDAVVFVGDRHEATRAEEEALWRAVADVNDDPSRNAETSLALVVARPAASAHEALAQHGETRDVEPILYDPADPAPAVSRMLMCLSSPRAERARP